MSDRKPQPGAKSPLSGCVILLTALAVVVFLVVFSIWTLFRQFDEIAKFTQASQTVLPVTDSTERESELRDLAGRLSAFREALASGSDARIALSPEDLNLAIAAWEPFKELRGTFRVDSAEEGRLKISISFPLNGRPRMAKGNERGFMVSDPRYLEGQMIARPAVSGKEVVLRIEELQIPGKVVPPEFVEQMSPYRITERYTDDPDLGPAMAGLTHVDVEDGCLILAKVAGAHAEGYLSDATVDASGSRLLKWLGLAACGFLMIAGLIVFTGLRKFARNRVG